MTRVTLALSLLLCLTSCSLFQRPEPIVITGDLQVVAVEEGQVVPAEGFFVTPAYFYRVYELAIEHKNHCLEGEIVLPEIPDDGR